MPAQNPYVLAVGAADPMGTDTRADDTVAAFSTGGSLATRRADLVAAGKSLVSLRVPNSYVDVLYPPARLAADPAQRFFRGSGTSQAAAFVSGAAALLLQQRPNLTPDQVKRLLTTTAQAMPHGDAVARGAGQLDLKAAFEAPTPKYTQTHPASTGHGSLDAARGTARVLDPDTGVELRGEIDIMGQPWAPATWAQASTAATAWTGGQWNGRTWSGQEWSARTWSGAVWDGRTWSARTWSGRIWSSAAWTGTTWSGRTWSACTWTGAVWDGRTWSARTWSGRTWSARTWSGTDPT
jgi:serine protease AprX